MKAPAATPFVVAASERTAASAPTHSSAEYGALPPETVPATTAMSPAETSVTDTADSDGSASAAAAIGAVQEVTPPETTATRAARFAVVQPGTDAEIAVGERDDSTAPRSTTVQPAAARAAGASASSRKEPRETVP